MAKVMFSSLSIALSVCLSVCLLVTFRKNGWTDFHEIFRVGGIWYTEQLGTFSGCSNKPLEHMIFSPLFRSNPCLIAALQKNGWRDFHEIFRKRSDMTHWAIWTIFGMLLLTPWILGGFIYFMVPCLFEMLWKNGWTDFHEIFMKRQAWHKK